MPGFARIPAEDAFQTTMKNKSNSTPRRDKKERYEPFASPTFIPSFTLDRGESVFTMGSCFARNIEETLVKNGFQVPLAEMKLPDGETYDGWKNPRGIFNKYNPFSMINEIKSAFEDTDPRQFMLESPKGWMDLQLHTDKYVTLDRALERRAEINALVRSAVTKCRIMIVTLGLIEAWYDNQTDLYTNQTPSLATIKQNPGRFSFEVLSPQATIEAVGDLVRLLMTHGRKDQRMLMTVSPVPIGRTFTDRDAMVANSYSKSILRVAAEIVVRENTHVDYFPSYESIMLSDRDITWEDDGVHVRNDIVKHNVERMIQKYAVQ